MLVKQRKGTDLEDPIRRVTARARARHQSFLMLISALFGVMALPIGYAATLPGATFDSLLAQAFDEAILLPALSNAFVMISSVRLTGQLDRKLAASLNLVLISHGALALVVLCLRLPYSNQIMGLAAVASCVLGPLVMWLAHDQAPPQTALLGGRPLPVGQLPPAFHVVDEPEHDLSAYDIILTPDPGDLSPEWHRTVSRAMLMGKSVRHFAEYMEEQRGIVSIEHFDLEHVPHAGLTAYRTRKRLLDIFLVVVSLPLTAPLILLSIIAVRLVMGGPALFVQRRVGLGGKEFKIYKLRTMDKEPSGGLDLATSSGDRRVTPLGRVLRRFRIDELPQLWNVLKGDMSVIGPRPEWIILHDRYVEKVPAYRYRNLVRPGITGWAQICGGYASDIEEVREKVGYDLYYIKNFSFALDVHIIVRTMWTIWSGFGAR